MNNTENHIGPPLGKMVGKERMVINTKQEIVWQAISDSKVLHLWSPPVNSVTILSDNPEKVGTARECHLTFGKKSGIFKEHRTAEISGQKIEYSIDSEKGIGIHKILKNTGFGLEIFPINENKVELEFKFYHDTNGIFGFLMNPMIKSQQKKDRHLALLSLKKYCESQ